MRFLLVNPFVDYSKVNRIFAIKAEIPPLGLLYVASSLENEGYQVSVIDFCAEDFSDTKLLRAVQQIEAVGITVRTLDINSVCYICNKIKRYAPHVTIIIGGPHCTIDPERAITETGADICVQGEGEQVITMIAEALKGKGSLNRIPGVFYFEDGVLKKGLPWEEIENLNKIPFPSLSLVNRYQYGEVVDGYNPTRGKVASLMTSRGCPYHCRYCINAAINKTYRTRSAENVIQELLEIKKNYQFLHIIDENFFADLKTANSILDFLIEDNHKLEIWISGIRVDAADEEVFCKMRDAGVSTINLGIESGNQEVLDFYNKGTTLEQCRTATHLARKMGFFTIGYFMMGAPIETELHLQNTIEFAKSLPLDNASFSPFAYLKGTPIWEDAVAQGKICEDEFTVLCDSTRGLGNFTTEEIWMWVIKAFQQFHLRPRFVIDQLIQSFIRWDFRVPKEGLKLLVRNDNALKIKTSNHTCNELLFNHCT